MIRQIDENSLLGSAPERVEPGGNLIMLITVISIGEYILCSINNYRLLINRPLILFKSNHSNVICNTHFVETTRFS